MKNVQSFAEFKQAHGVISEQIAKLGNLGRQNIPEACTLVYRFQNQ
jgi:hypothetical protein